MEIKDKAVICESIGDILSPTADKLAKAGHVRDGGAYIEQMGKVACRKSVMDENQYMVRKCKEFIAA